MSRAATWTNKDGLVVGYGRHSIDNNVPSVRGGTVKEYVIHLPAAASLEANASITTASIPPQSAVIPRGSIIKSAKFQVTTAFATSASGALNIGTHSAAAVDDDIDGIDALVAVTALDAIGAVVNCDGALVNGVTSCGAASTSDVVVTFGYSTGVFTAGAGILTLEVVVPHGVQGSSFAAVE